MIAPFLEVAPILLPGTPHLPRSVVWTSWDLRLVPGRMVADGNIVFRVAPHSRLAGPLDETVVAFQVDEIDDLLECGWGVLVVGRAHPVADLAGLPHMWAERPHPWASGGRDLYIRLHPTDITGRRVFPT